MSSSGAEVRLVNGDVFTITGDLEEVERRLSDAARSGHSRLAWFNELGTGDAIGVNPATVAALRPTEHSG